MTIQPPSATTDITNNVSTEAAMKRFISTLTPDERLLIEDYVDTPNPDTLSKSFDAIVEQKSS